jgi:hypothetical protein
VGQFTHFGGSIANVPAPKKQQKADASEKARSTARDWLTTGELATKLGWREHALRDALRGRELAGVRRTSFGYHIEASAVDEITRTLGDAPAKGNARKRDQPAAR